ncbi:hypothetical protein BsWGS_12020 [Bradybaena similaris]
MGADHIRRGPIPSGENSDIFQRSYSDGGCLHPNNRLDSLPHFLHSTEQSRFVLENTLCKSADDYFNSGSSNTSKVTLFHLLS